MKNIALIASIVFALDFIKMLTLNGIDSAMPWFCAVVWSSLYYISKEDRYDK